MYEIFHNITFIQQFQNIRRNKMSHQNKTSKIFERRVIVILLKNYGWKHGELHQKNKENVHNERRWKGKIFDHVTVGNWDNINNWTLFSWKKKKLNSKNCKCGKVHIVLQAGLKNNDGVLDFKSFHLLYIYQFSIYIV